MRQFVHGAVRLVLRHGIDTLRDTERQKPEHVPLLPQVMLRAGIFCAARRIDALYPLASGRRVWETHPTGSWSTAVCNTGDSRQIVSFLADRIDGVRSFSNAAMSGQRTLPVLQ